MHWKDLCACIQLYEQTFDVTLEELGQDSIRRQLVKHTAEELLCYTRYVPRDQHTAKNITGIMSVLGPAVALHRYH